VLDAQAQWMIGHRGKEFEAAARIQPRLRDLFYTKSRVHLDVVGYGPAGGRGA
jgi:hypothetical protein